MTDPPFSNPIDVGQKYSPVKARFLTAIFVFFDVLSFIVQGAGGSLYSSDNIKLYPIAKTVLIIGPFSRQLRRQFCSRLVALGFLIQIISFGIFGIVAIICTLPSLPPVLLETMLIKFILADQIRARRGGEPQGPWVKCLYTLYIGSSISPIS